MVVNIPSSGQPLFESSVSSEFINVEDAVLIAQKYANLLGASVHHYRQIFLCDDMLYPTTKKEIRESLPWLPHFVGFLVNPPSEIEHTSFKTRQQALHDEMTWLSETIVKFDDLGGSEEELVDLLKSANILKRLQKRVEYTLDLIHRVSQPTPEVHRSSKKNKP